MIDNCSGSRAFSTIGHVNKLTDKKCEELSYVSNTAAA